MSNLDHLSRKQLVGMLDDFAKNWLAHDGLWFQAIEARHGMETAIECDTEAWRQFTVIEARRIMKRHNIADDSGLEGLKKPWVIDCTPDLTNSQFWRRQRIASCFKCRRVASRVPESGMD